LKRSIQAMAVFAVAPRGSDYPGGSVKPSESGLFSSSKSKTAGGMSYDKLVKGATKTKHAAPKEKYISGLVQATHESDYACSDIAQAIAPRLRDSNSTVVFKALIITHLILRSGNIKNVYSTWWFSGLHPTTR